MESKTFKGQKTHSSQGNIRVMEVRVVEAFHKSLSEIFHGANEFARVTETFEL